MKRFIFCLLVILLAAFAVTSVGCNGEHDQWMELVNSIDVSPETSAEVSEAIPKRYNENYGDALLTIDSTSNIESDRSHIEMRECLSANYIDFCVMSFSGLQQDFG